MKLNTMQHSKRIDWAERAWGILRRDLLPTMPELAAITVGFPSRKGKKGSNHTIGECCYRFKGEGEAHLISLHPELLSAEPTRILDVLLHEAIHASLPVGSGHKAKFRAAMREVGLEGKPTATVAGEVLMGRLNTILTELGSIPAGTLASVEDGRKKQTTRMRKYECSCGQIVRAATDDLNATCGECKQDFELAS